jgi:PAS domain S-box-containing protein
MPFLSTVFFKAWQSYHNNQYYWFSGAGLLYLIDLQSIPLQLFSFHFDNAAGILIALIPGIINFLLLFYIIFRLPKNQVTNVFALLTLAMGLWQINDVMARISISAEITDQWDCIFGASWILVGPLCLHFALLYNNSVKEENSRQMAYLLYTPAFIFLGIYQSHIFPHRFIDRGIWGWVNNHDTYFLDQLMIYWISLLVLAATVLMFYKSYKVREDALLNYQSILITVGIAVPTLCGLISQVVLPIFLDQPAVPVTSTFMTFFSVTTVIALKKYKLFRVSDLISNEKLIESLPVILLNITNTGRINFINKTGVDVLGFTVRKAHLSESFEQIIKFGCEAHKENFIKAWNDALSGEKVTDVESSLVSKDKIYDIQVSANPIINNNQIEGVLVTIRDITELKISGRKIRESEVMLKKSQQMAHLGSWQWDIKADHVIWSDELYKIFGLRPQSVPISYSYFTDRIHPEDKERAENIIATALREGKSFDFYHRILQKNGTEKIVRAHGEIDMEENGTVVSMKGTLQDVTIEKAHEEMLQKQNIELQKINSELDKFVYSVSHDLRSPLTSMLGLIMITEEETTDKLLRQNLSMLKKSVLKLDKFIVDILHYSKNARTDIDPAVVNLEELTDEIIHHLKYISQEKFNVTVNANCDAILVSDRTRLFIILNNLISNAFHYADPEKEESFIRIDISVKETSAEITISDNGVGISRDHQSRVFEMFFRGTSVSQGSGLGLYIVKDTIEKLGGEISLKSELGIGTAFKVTMPNLASEQSGVIA